MYTKQSHQHKEAQTLLQARTHHSNIRVCKLDTKITLPKTCETSTALDIMNLKNHPYPDMLNTLWQHQFWTEKIWVKLQMTNYQVQRRKKLHKTVNMVEKNWLRVRLYKTCATPMMSDCLATYKSTLCSKFNKTITLPLVFPFKPVFFNPHMVKGIIYHLTYTQSQHHYNRLPNSQTTIQKERRKCYNLY